MVVIITISRVFNATESSPFSSSTISCQYLSPTSCQLVRVHKRHCSEANDVYSFGFNADGSDADGGGDADVSDDDGSGDDDPALHIF